MRKQRNSASHNFIVKDGSNTRLCFPCRIVKRGERNVKVKWPSKIGSTGKSPRAGSHQRRKQRKPSDSDSVELPTLLPIPIFDLHCIVTLLAIPIPTPLPIPSLVWTSPKSKQTNWNVLQLQSTKVIISCSTHVHTHKKHQHKAQYQPCRLNTWFSPTSFFPVTIQKKPGKITIRHEALCKTARSVSF